MYHHCQEVIKHVRAKTASQQVVMTVLAFNADDDGIVTFTYTQLAEQCRITTTTVDRAITHLAKRGYIALEPVRDRQRVRDYKSRTAHITINETEA